MNDISEHQIAIRVKMMQLLYKVNHSNKPPNKPKILSDVKVYAVIIMAIAPIAFTWPLTTQAKGGIENIALTAWVLGFILLIVDCFKLADKINETGANK